MYTLLISIVIVTIGGLYLVKDSNISEKVLAGMFSIIVGFVIGIIMVDIIGSFIPKNIQTIIRIPIYSGFNNNVLHGSPFLFSVTINEKDTVFYWTKTPDGALKKESIDMKDVVFYEEDRLDGELVDIQYFCNTTAWYACRESHNYSFHVPYKSIYTEFEYK
jgi:hypothetical protein